MSLVRAFGLALPGRLDPTDLALEAGSLTCLVGPNGSGKTSLLHALAGIGAPSGWVEIGGVDPASLGPARRPRALTFLPASRDVKWPLTAIDLIRLGASGPLDDCLDVLELGALADRRVDRLSTGERGRVLIARALAQRPRLLLLDEPVANLDPLWQLRLMEHLRALVRREAAAALVAMHDLELAARFGDRLIVMDRCRIAADGEPHALLEGPAMREVFGIERAGGVWRPVG